ncbi:MAG TPA: efflux RND transporter periplasmic adaptor subunit [Anaerolineales bacterium]|nr:efflux RND transporter periplasmic adaptor subunit [Anaerolineales bacterium]
MKKTMIAIIALGMLTTACSPPTDTASVTPEAIPTVLADDTIIAEGRVEPIQYAEIAFTTSGMVGEVMVDEGQTVKQGDPVIRLGSETDSSYAAAQLELANAQQAMDDLVNSRGADFAQAVIDLHDAEDEYTRADNYLRYLKTSDSVPQTTYSVKLVQTTRGYEYKPEAKNFKGPASEEWILNAENDLALKKAALDNAQRLYDNLKDGPNAEQLPVLEARLSAAKLAVAAFTITAPFDGVVAELNAKIGSTINAGEIAIVIADTSKWIVLTTDVTEIDVVKLSEGQLATVTLDAIPDVALKGEILIIGQNYSENQGDIVYKVTVLLIDTDPAMRWGMTAAVKFEQ